MNNSKELRELLLSDNNIYKAILSIESYLFNPQLLDNHDIKLLNELNDKFNFELLYRSSKKNKLLETEFYHEEVEDILLNGGLIDYVKKRIETIIDDKTKLFKTKVHFKVKDHSTPKYRPLHTTNVIDSIAIVSMLQIIIFDMKKDDRNTEIKLSNLSKLIPSNFYGNIPSKSPERLFDKWQVKYKDYTEIVNKRFAFHQENGEYKSEVVLDLINFFPSINTGIVFDFIIETLEVKYSDEDLDLLKKVIFKILYFEVDNFNDCCQEIIEKHYYSDKIDGYINRLGGKTNYLTKGVPQGLPQSYFFGNLVMIEISKIYDSIFRGESYFYVDDSVIYTSSITEENKFSDLLVSVNQKLKVLSTDVKAPAKKYLENNLEEIGYKYISDEVIAAHESGKSHYQHISTSKFGYQYLKHLSRLASVGAFDISTTFDDHQEVQIKEKFLKIIEAINNEIELTCSTINALPGNKRKLINGSCENDNCKDCKEQCIQFHNYEEYISKLERFIRFFKYRVLLVNIQESKSEIEAIEREMSIPVLNPSPNRLMEINIPNSRKAVYR